MDSLDRMFRHLVRTVRAKYPQYLSQPFGVAELYQTILPYRLHRRELALESNDDYEITLTELLAGGRDYLIVDDGMRTALRQELESRNADPGAFKRFGESTVAISPAALRSLDAGPVTDTPLLTEAQPGVSHAPMSAPASTSQEKVAPSASPEQPRREPAPTAARTSEAAPRTSAATVTRGAITPEPGTRCGACDGELPAGRAITFCPHCGQNLTRINCPACGSELEVGWKFCPTCGRAAANR